VLAHGHEALVVTGAAAPDAEYELETGLAVTVDGPGVGTTVVTTRRLITLRTRTGRGAEAARPALSW
jgi:hypothetical protein